VQLVLHVENLLLHVVVLRFQQSNLKCRVHFVQDVEKLLRHVDVQRILQRIFALRVEKKRNHADAQLALLNKREVFEFLFVVCFLSYVVSSLISSLVLCFFLFAMHALFRICLVPRRKPKKSRGKALCPLKTSHHRFLSLQGRRQFAQYHF
jgi:hypothetical protein